jgi:hypothetical protein
MLNGDFELGPAGINGYSIFDAGQLPGWQTNASDGKVEIWTSGFLGVQAHSGSRFTELNANQASTMSQLIFGLPAGSTFGYQFAHRGRATDESVRVQITDLGADQTWGTGDDSLLLNRVYTDGTAGWGYYTGSNLIALGNAVRYSFESLTAGSIGNFIDNTALGVNVGGPTVGTNNQGVPEPASILLVVLAAAAVFGVMRARKPAPTTQAH